MNIRKAKSSDTFHMWSVRTSAIRAIGSQFYEAAVLERWANVALPESFAEVIAILETRVATVEDCVVGWGMVDVKGKQFEALFVDPEFQRQGIGEEMYSQLETFAWIQKLDRLELSSTLNAEAFYQRVGYQATGRSAYRHPNGFELDCVKMVKGAGKHCAQ